MLKIKPLILSAMLTSYTGLALADNDKPETTQVPAVSHPEQSVMSLLAMAGAPSTLPTALCQDMMLRQQLQRMEQLQLIVNADDPATQAQYAAQYQAKAKRALADVADITLNTEQLDLSTLQAIDPAEQEFFNGETTDKIQQQGEIKILIDKAPFEITLPVVVVGEKWCLGPF